MSDNFPSLWAVAYATAPTLSDALAHRNPSESHGGNPITTLNGRCAGSLKWERNSSTNSPSKSGGNFAMESTAVTAIFTTDDTESAAWRVSRQPAVATRGWALVVFDREFVAQAATRARRSGTVERRLTGKI